MNTWFLPTIDFELCTGCALCVTNCAAQSVQMVDERPIIIRPGTCSYCGECEEICPEGAIALRYEIVLAASYWQ